MPAATIQVELPQLHKGREGNGGQQEIATNKARFKVVVCGRRWGKTHLGVFLCLKTSLQGGLTWWVAPTYPIANIGWRILKNLVRQIPGCDIHEADRYVELPGGGEVWVKSADNPDSLRGEGLDGVVLDEVAQIREVAWQEALRPALADKKGWALFIGTPKGKNWVWRLYQRGLHDPQWASFKRPTIDNPYIDPLEIEQARLDATSEAVFKQEYEADFGASQLQVYPDFDRHMHVWKLPIPEFEMFFGGLDFAGDTIGAHKSAGIISGMTKSGIMVGLAEFKQSGPNVTERQLMWIAEQEKQLLTLQRRLGHRPAKFHWRADKSQSAFIGLTRAMGFSVVKTKGGADSVQNGVNLVQRRLQFRGDGKARFYYLPELHYLPDDMEAYRYPESRDPEEPQPRNPLKVNDDLMDALRYMIEGADQYTIGNPEELYKDVLATVA